MNEQALSVKGIKLALKFELTVEELQVLCKKFGELEINEEFSTGMKAISLVSMVKQAIDYKFENILIEEKHLIHGLKEAPTPDLTKAKIVKGLFLTFIEHQHGLPGFFSIISGVKAAGFGMGSFAIEGISEKLKLSDLSKIEFNRNTIASSQADFFNQTLTPEVLSAFANVRLGVYCLTVGCSLIPLYAKALKKHDKNGLDDSGIAQKAQSILTQKFSPHSEKLVRFTSQNLFRVIFEELFNYESTVYSIFT